MKLRANKLYLVSSAHATWYKSQVCNGHMLKIQKCKTSRIRQQYKLHNISSYPTHVMEKDGWISKSPKRRQQRADVKLVKVSVPFLKVVKVIQFTTTRSHEINLKYSKHHFFVNLIFIAIAIMNPVNNTIILSAFHCRRRKKQWSKNTPSVWKVEGQ